MGECVLSRGRLSQKREHPPYPQLLLQGLLCYQRPCIPQACPIVCKVLGPGIVPAPELRLSTQRGECLQARQAGMSLQERAGHLHLLLHSLLCSN